MPPGLNPGFPQPPIANPGAGNPGAALNPPAMPNIGAGPRDVGVPPAGAAPAPNVGGFNAANPAAVNAFFHNGKGADSSNLTALWIVLAVLGSMGIVGGIIFAIVRGVSAY